MRTLASRVLVRSAGCLLLVLTPLAGQTERESEVVEASLRAISRHVEELQAQGRHDVAEELARAMRELRRDLGARAARRDRGESGERGRRAEILHGLEQGMHALELLGRRDAMDVLRRIADEVRAEGEHPEIREARRQLEVLQVALAALREAERGDAADLMQRAIRARELNLEGRRDEEAQELRRRAPDREQLVELLRLSSRLWAEWGHEHRAAATFELAEQMMRGRRRAAGERERERDREHVREREREHGEREHEEERRHERDGDDLLARLRRLEERMARVERALERLGREWQSR